MTPVGRVDNQPYALPFCALPLCRWFGGHLTSAHSDETAIMPKVTVPEYISLRSKTYPALELRSATLADAPAISQIFTDPVNIELDKIDPAKFSVPLVEPRIQRWNAEAQMDPVKTVSLVVVVDGLVQGIGGMGHIAHDEATGRRTGDAGVMLNMAVRRKGYAGEAIWLTTEFAFAVLQLDAVTVTMDARNTAMAGVMRKLKWKEERIEQGELLGVSELMFRMSPEEWEQKKSL